MDSNLFLRDAMAFSGPESVQSEGEFTAAREICSSTYLPASDIARGTANILPAGICCMMRPRAATIFRASSSEKTPARQAAVYSPMLWPIIEFGKTPQD